MLIKEKPKKFDGDIFSGVNYTRWMQPKNNGLNITKIGHNFIDTKYFDFIREYCEEQKYGSVEIILEKDRIHFNQGEDFRATIMCLNCID